VGPVSLAPPVPRFAPLHTLWAVPHTRFSQSDAPASTCNRERAGADLTKLEMLAQPFPHVAAFNPADGLPAPPDEEAFDSKGALNSAEDAYRDKHGEVVDLPDHPGADRVRRRQEDLNDRRYTWEESKSGSSALSQPSAAGSRVRSDQCRVDDLMAVDELPDSVRHRLGCARGVAWRPSRRPRCRRKRRCQNARTLAVQANGSPASAVYHETKPGKPLQPFGIQILTIRGSWIAAIDIHLEPDLFAIFDLPSELPPESARTDVPTTTA
jgi:hypothetical protein